MNPTNAPYIIIIGFVIVWVLLTIDTLIKRFLPIGCIVMITGLIVAAFAFVYTLNH